MFLPYMAVAIAENSTDGESRKSDLMNQYQVHPCWMRIPYMAVVIAASVEFPSTYSTRENIHVGSGVAPLLGRAFGHCLTAWHGADVNSARVCPCMPLQTTVMFE